MIPSMTTRQHGSAGRAGRLPPLWQRGFTLVELSVSMAIAAILVVASLAVLRDQLDQAQVASSSYFLQKIALSLQDFYVGDDGSAPINNGALAGSAAVAREYVGVGAGNNVPISNPWGGRLFLGRLISNSNADWVLQVSGLPMRLCSDIAQGVESSLGAAGVRHGMAGAPTAGSDIATPALASVSLDDARTLQTALPNVYVLKNTPYVPLDPAALGSLCEGNQPYFNLFLTGSNNAL